MTWTLFGGTAVAAIGLAAAELGALAVALLMMASVALIVVAGLAHARAAQAEQQLELLRRGGDDGFWEWDVRRARASYSARWMAVAGLPAADTEGNLDLWLDRVHPDDVASLRAALLELEGGRSESFEHPHRLHGADGAFRWVLARGAAVREADRVVHTGGSLSDLTGARAAAHAQERAVLLEQAASATQAGVGLLLIDGTVRQADDALHRLARPWRSPDVWWRKVSAAGKLPSATPCARCGEPELRGVLLAEVLAPTAGDSAPNARPSWRTYRVALGGHAHDASDEPGAHLLLAQDVTGEATVRAALLRGDEQYALSASATNDGLWGWDEHHGLWVSARWRALVGLSEDDPISDIEGWLGHVTPEDREQLRSVMNGACRSELARLDHYHRILLPNGELRALRVLGVSVRDTNGIRLGGAIRLEEAWPCGLDALLGIRGREAFITDTGAALKAARRAGHDYVAIAVVDLAGLAGVHEQLGSLAGERALRASAERVGQALGERAVVYRTSNDALGLIVHGVLGASELLAVLEAVVREASRGIDVDGKDVVLAVGAGGALLSSGFATGHEAALDVEAAARTAALRGPGAVIVLDQPTRRSSPRAMGLMASLRGALDQAELTVQYQPIVSMRTLRITHMEALVRWRHPEHGLSPPDELVTIAEETGLVVPLGDFVLRSALLRLAAWTHELGPEVSTFGVSVNLSTRQLADDGLAARVAALLGEAGVAPERLQLEIADAEALIADPLATARVAALRALGVRVALDDVRAGGLSADALRGLSIDGLKMERAILRGDLADEAAHITSLVETAHALGVPAIAVGVETREQLLVLSRLGCDGMQGYYFARPTDADDVTRLLGGWSETARALLPSDARRALMRAVR